MFENCYSMNSPAYLAKALFTGIHPQRINADMIKVAYLDYAVTGFRRPTHNNIPAIKRYY